MRIYLDVCCLCRPFDDQSNARVSDETDIINLIFEYIGDGYLQWISSEIVDKEIDRTPSDARRNNLKRLSRYTNESVAVDYQDLSRIVILMELGFRMYDAMHIRCAEKGRADFLLTTDDKLLRLAKRNQDKLDVTVENPVSWLRGEVTE